MNRRHFLQGFLAASVATATGLELMELWKPRTLYFLPPRTTPITLFGRELIFDSMTTAEEFIYIINRAFVPKLVEQIYDASPRFSKFIHCPARVAWEG